MFFLLPIQTLSGKDRLYNCPPGDKINLTYNDQSKFETIQFCKNIIHLEVSGLITSLPGSFAKGVENLQTVSLGNKVDTINPSCFQDCTHLTQINLENIKVLGESAFENCVSLASITFKNPELVLIPKKCFSGCIKLATCEFGSNFKHYIDSLAFSSCYELKSIFLYENCSLNSFASCKNLETITVQKGPFNRLCFLGLKIKNVHMIEKTNFCSSDGIYFEDSQCTKIAYYPPYHDGKIYEVQSGVTHFCDSSFNSVINLETLEFVDQNPNIILGSSVFTSSSIQTIDLHWFSAITPTEGAFNSLPELRKVILIDGSKFIQPKMFQNCVKLQEINLSLISTFPASIFENTGITVIDLQNPVDLSNEAVFKDCLQLKSISISKLQPLKLGKQVFMGCTSLASLSVPGSDNFVFGEAVFKNCGQLAAVDDFGENCIFEAECFANCVSVDYLVISPTSQIMSKAFYNTGFRTLRVTTYDRWEETLTFAETKKLEDLIVGPTCTGIPDSAFLNSGVKNVSFYEPSKIRSIGACSFQNTMISKITLPKSITSIGEGAFSGCHQLVAFSFQENSQVTEIPDVCFYGSLALSGIQFPENVTKIGSDSFGNCTSLENVIFNEKITQISEKCFEYTSIKALVLPKLLAEIGVKAFFSCISLATVTFTGDSLQAIQNYCFLDCKSLEKVTIPETQSVLYSIGLNCFARCIKLTEFSFNKCDKIGSYAFYRSGLTGIHITTSITTIGDAAFLHCKSLKAENLVSDENSKFKFTADKLLVDSEETKVIHSFEIAELIEYNIPEKVATFEPSAFSGNGIVAKVTFKAGINNVYFTGCKNLKTVLNFGSTEIAEGACQNCQILATVTLASTVVSIKANAFLNCIALAGFSLADVTEIGTNSFMNCTSFKEITIKKLTSMGFNAFKGSGVERIALGETTQISSCCFEDTASLTSVDAPKVVVIQDSAFKNSGLKTITISDNYTNIESAAFQNCKNLKSFKLNEQIIQPLTFSGSGIEGEITYSGTIVGYRAFEKTKITKFNAPKLATLEPFAFSQCELLASFENDQEINWNSDYTYENGHQFSECIGLKTVSLKNVKTLPTEIFLRCRQLKAIRLDSITKIESYSFMDCVALDTITFKSETQENELTLIDVGAFSGCSSLASIDFALKSKAKNLTTISQFAFNATGLSGTVKIPIGAQTIVDAATHDSIINLIFYNTFKVTAYTLEPNNGEDQDDRFIDLNGIIYYKKVMLVNNEKVTLKNEVAAYPFGKESEASFMRDITFIQMNAFVDREMKLAIPFDWTGSKISKLAFRNPATQSKTNKAVTVLAGRFFSYTNYGNGEETWGKNVQINAFNPPTNPQSSQATTTAGKSNGKTLIIVMGSLLGVFFIAIVVAVAVICKKKKMKSEISTSNETLL